MMFDISRLRPASFNGRPFWVETSETEAGHRVATTGLPGGLHVNESFGPAARKYQIEAYVIGAGYEVQAQSLIDAAETAHTGLLILPDQPPARVRLTKVTRKFEREKIGRAVVAIEATIEPDAGSGLTVWQLFAALIAAIDAIPAAAGSYLAAVFPPVSSSVGIANAAVAPVARLHALAAQGQPEPATPIPSDQEAALDMAAASAMTATSDPVAYGAALIAAAATVGAGASPVALSGLLAALGPPETAAALATTSDAAAAEVLAGLAALSTTADAVTLLAAEARRVPRDRQEDVEARAITASVVSTALGRIGRQGGEIAAALSSAFESYAALVTLRSSDIAPTIAVAVGRSLPAQVLAHRLYGSPARADEIAQRAVAAHPGFMPQRFIALSA
jgi:prophage DNA circulation protein